MKNDQKHQKNKKIKKKKKDRVRRISTSANFDFRQLTEVELAEVEHSHRCHRQRSRTVTCKFQQRMSEIEVVAAGLQIHHGHSWPWTSHSGPQSLRSEHLGQPLPLSTEPHCHVAGRKTPSTQSWWRANGAELSWWRWRLAECGARRLWIRGRHASSRTRDAPVATSFGILIWQHLANFSTEFGQGPEG